MIVTTLVPISVLGVLLVLVNPLRERDAIRHGMKDTARALSIAADRQARIAIAGLQALATSPSLRDGDYPSFRKQVDLFLASHEGWISVVDETGQQHLNTRLDPTAALPRTNNRVWLDHIFGASDVYIAGAVTGPVVEEPFVAISLRVQRPTYPVALTLSIAPETLTRLLQEQRLPEGWIGVITDSEGTIIGRTQSPEFIGRAMPLRLTSPSGLTSTVTLEGTPVYIAWTKSKVTGWSTGVAATTGIIDFKVRDRVLYIVIAALVVLLLTATLSFLLSRRVIRPLASLAEAVSRSSTSPEQLPRPVTGLTEIDALTSAFRSKLTDMTAAVTSRDRVEAELRDREAKLHDLVRTLDLAAIMIRGMDGRIKFWSKGCEALYGWTSHEAVGNIAHELLETEYPIPREQLEAILIKEGSWSGDFMQRRRDGYLLTVAVQKALQRGEDRQPVAVLESLSDVTALRQARLELTHLNEHLELRVREEIAAREAAQVRAAHAERMHALGQLAGGIAHDMNNVLQATTGGAALVERRPDNVTQVRRFARMILEAGMRGTSITQRLLAFARKSDLRAEVIDVGELFNGSQEILSHTLEVNISIRVVEMAERFQLVADKGQLETVLVNIATNSRDAMPSGGTITFTARRQLVSPDAARCVELQAGSYIVIAIADTGVGMDQTILARAAEPFFTTKGVGRGTGLGLATARGFAEQSGGRLQIDSTLNVGTTVSLWLPEARSNQPLDEERGRRVSNFRDAERRVLLIDDDTLVRETIASQLEESGYVVTATTSAEDALSLLHSGGHVDCIVTDLSMPGMDGLTLIKLAQRDQPNLPAILLTGYAQDTTALAIGGAISGTFSLLRKPIQGDELSDRIASLMASLPEIGR
jgi:PAS domain S-box-containing protein